MAIQLSVGVRNARLDQIATTVGASPKLRLYTGAPPASTSAASTGTLLAEIALPATWMAAAAGGAKGLTGTWQVAAAAAAGNAGYFRLYDSAGTTCHMQGTVTATGGGGDMELDNVSIGSGQQVTITSFTLTDANA